MTDAATYLPCIKRQVIERIARDGSKSNVCRCASVLAEKFGKNVAPEDCSACPLRTATNFKPPGHIEWPVMDRDFGEPRIAADGSIHYKRNGIEPPPPHAGYKRKSEDIESDDAWVFAPVFKPCLHREMVNGVRPCGCLKINAICVSKNSGQEGKVVTPSICLQCPARWEPGMIEPGQAAMS